MNKPKEIMLPKIIPRKSPPKLSERAISNSGNKIVVNAVSHFGCESDSGVMLATCWLRKRKGKTM